MSTAREPHHHNLWASGTLRCVLVTYFEPRRFAVMVFNDDSPVVTERCDTLEEGAEIGERLWKMFVAPSKLRA